MPMPRRVIAWIATSLLLVSGSAAALAQGQPRSADPAGVFDHYLLALTWMPSFCAMTGDGRGDARCTAGQRLGWQVHGLWPQHADGSWPEYCRSPHRNPSRQETGRQAGMFGASGAAWHQWNKHGTCTSLSPADYYALTRLAWEGLVLPEIFDAVTRDLVVAPAVIGAAVIEANPGLTDDMLLVTCRRDAVYELRLCLTRDLQPRPCAPQTRLRACALDAARLPALR